MRDGKYDRSNTEERKRRVKGDLPAKDVGEAGINRLDDHHSHCKGDVGPKCGQGRPRKVISDSLLREAQCVSKMIVSNNALFIKLPGLQQPTWWHPRTPRKPLIAEL